MLSCRQLNTVGHVLQHYNIAVAHPGAKDKWLKQYWGNALIT